MITGAGIVAETGPETYVATPVTKLYAGPAFDAGVRFAYVLSEQENNSS